MNSKLTIQERLKDLRVERNLTLEQLAEATGLSRAALGNYETNDLKDISPFSIIRLAQFYGVSTDYLLGLIEQKNHSNTELDSLHLSDEMIELLQSGRINNRLLCEIAIHDNFHRLMADIEIYVDRIASMQINNLNAMLDVVRAEILSRYNPIEDDLYMRTLNAACVHEDEYFSHTVHDDIDAIIRDIRKSHAKDSNTASEVTVTEGLKRQIEDIANFKGSSQEKQVRIFCAQLGIAYDKLTSVEFITLIQVLKKSKYLKRKNKNRGQTRKLSKGE